MLSLPCALVIRSSCRPSPYGHCWAGCDPAGTTEWWVFALCGPPERIPGPEYVQCTGPRSTVHSGRSTTRKPASQQCPHLPCLLSACLSVWQLWVQTPHWPGAEAQRPFPPADFSIPRLFFHSGALLPLWGVKALWGPGSGFWAPQPVSPVSPLVYCPWTWPFQRSVCLSFVLCFTTWPRALGLGAKGGLPHCSTLALPQGHPTSWRGCFVGPVHHVVPTALQTPTRVPSATLPSPLTRFRNATKAAPSGARAGEDGRPQEPGPKVSK